MFTGHKLVLAVSCVFFLHAAFYSVRRERQVSVNVELDIFRDIWVYSNMLSRNERRWAEAGKCFSMSLWR